MALQMQQAVYHFTLYIKGMIFHSSSLGLWYHVPLQRDQGDWDRRLRLSYNPNAIG